MREIKVMGWRGEGRSTRSDVVENVARLGVKLQRIAAETVIRQLLVALNLPLEIGYQ
jgi:hypothetical protein